MITMPRYLTGAMLCLMLLCSACGFQLRGDASLPPEMVHTQMVIANDYSALARQVRMMLEQNGVQFVSGKDATAILEIPQDRLVTEVLTIADGFFAVVGAGLAAFYANRRLTRKEYFALRLWSEEQKSG